MDPFILLGILAVIIGIAGVIVLLKGRTKAQNDSRSIPRGD